MPFGAVGAVYGWHRFANLYLAALRRLLFVPSAKFVDDFYGAGRDGVRLSGGPVLTRLSRMVGAKTDTAKDEDQAKDMVVLGARTRV